MHANFGQPHPSYTQLSSLQPLIWLCKYFKWTYHRLWVWLCFYPYTTMTTYQLSVVLLLYFIVWCSIAYCCALCLLLFPSYVQVFQVDQHYACILLLLMHGITCLNVFCLFLYLPIKLISTVNNQCILLCPSVLAGSHVGSPVAFSDSMYRASV